MNTSRPGYLEHVRQNPSSHRAFILLSAEDNKWTNTISAAAPALLPLRLLPWSNTVIQASGHQHSVPFRISSSFNVDRVWRRWNRTLQLSICFHKKMNSNVDLLMISFSNHRCWIVNPSWPHSMNPPEKQVRSENQSSDAIYDNKWIQF
jgi:hypothetical protein